MCETTSDNTYGYTLEVWERAKLEATRAIVREGQKGSTISYSDLTKQISSIPFGPHDSIFHHLLGQISVEEDAAGRGMLSALVVHKDDGLPGDGFWDLAHRLGRDTRDNVECWTKEIKLVLEHCTKRPQAA